MTEHGLEPSACKSDLYTLAGIDSKHPSGIRSSLWRPAEVLDGGVEQIKASTAVRMAAQTEFSCQKLKDQHWNKTRNPLGDGSKKSKPGADGLIDSDSEDEKVVQATKRKAGLGEADSKPALTVPTKSQAGPRAPKKARSAA